MTAPTTTTAPTATEPRSGSRRRTIPLAFAVIIGVMGFLVGAGAFGGRSSPAVQAASSPAGTVKACSLVSRADMSKALGTEVRSVTPSSSGSATSCQYRMGKGGQSVTLALLSQPVPAATFDSEMQKMTAKLKSPVEKVAGIGDDAYVLMLRSIADLQVRVGDRALTVIIVGRDDDDAKARATLEQIGRAAVEGLRAAAG